MLKKRIIPVVSIYNSQVVQSFEFKKKLPLGSPIHFIENFNRWNVDEILVVDFSRTKNQLNPDYNLLKQIGSLKGNSPLTYIGGISDYKNAVEIIKSGFERIGIDQLYFDSTEKIKKISEKIGSQSIIISIPFYIKRNKIFHYNYLTKKSAPLDYNKILLMRNFFSEILFIDCNNEGIQNSFNNKFLKIISKNIKQIPFLVCGGISDNNQILRLLKNKLISGVCIENFLNYKELSYQNIKHFLIFKNKNLIREPFFFKS